MIKVATICAIDVTAKVLLSAQLQAVSKAGYEVHIVCSQGSNYEWLQKRGWRVYPVTIKRSISPFSDLVALWRMYRYFKRERIDIIHTHTPKCSLLGQLAAKMARVPVIVNTVHGYYFHDNMKPLTRWFYITMERIAAKCSTVILSQNPEDIETAVKLGICTRDNIRLLGNGVDLDKFKPDRFNSEFKHKKRNETEIPEEAIVVCIIGRLVREKGYIELFEAMQEITQENDNVWLMIAGPEEPVKTDRISSNTFKDYGIEKRTRYLGSRDDIPELLACCDIYALPSWREGFPRSAIEAAAMALPIVATNIRGCREVVENGRNGFLVELKNTNELKKALVKLIENPELRIQMGRAGYEKAQKEFDENKVCEIVLDTYKKCLTDYDGA